ncbi:MAG: Gfo/Idh/MocA family protein [Armatimonadota bacterium]
MARQFGIAFCGAGGFVRGHHLPELAKRPDKFHIAGFYDVSVERAQQLAGDVHRVYASYEELLTDPAVDLVTVITRPHSTHFPLAKQALEAGKNVMLEKPMAVTTEECDALIALAREKNLLLTVHQNRRLNLDFLATREILRQEKVGQPQLIENRWPGGSYGGGDFLDFGIHLMDQSLLLNDSSLVEVSALFANPVEAPENGGYAEITLRFEQPPIVRLVMLPRPQEYLLNGTPAIARFFVVGTTGSFVQRLIEDSRDLMNALVNFDKARPEYAVPPFLEIKQKGYHDYLYETLADGAPLFVRPEEARNAIRAIELAVESARTGRSVPATNMLVPVHSS